MPDIDPYDEEAANYAGERSPAIGHNKPPSLEEIVAQTFREQHADVAKRKADLVDAATRLPDEVTAENAGKLATFITQLTSVMNNLEKVRAELKEPHLRTGKAVDGYFKAEKEEVKNIRTKAENALTGFQEAERETARAAAEAKAAEERAAREAEERRQRERARILAEEEARKRRAEAAKAEAAAQDEKALDDAVAKDEAARIAEQAAAQAAQEAEAPPPTPAPAPEPVPVSAPAIETEYGQTATLSYRWECTGFDRETVDLEKLRPYLSGDAIQRALNAAVRQGAREIKGAQIEEVAKSRVR